MKTNEESIRPTNSKPVSDLSKKYETNFKKTMNQVSPNTKLNEVDQLLSEEEFSLKKKIFSLPKMEALVFSDPKLTQVYNDMSEEGEEKYGYHYNETIMNILFNDYILNSPKYLQKYKMAIPKVKKRRDKSGINQLKKAGEIVMHHKDPQFKAKPATPQTEEIANETTGAAGAGAFAPALGYEKRVEETTTSASSGAYVGPAAWGGGDLMKGGKSKAMRKPIWQGGTIIGESKKNYLINPVAFESFYNNLNEADLSYQEELGNEYHQSHDGSNKGLGVSEIPQSPARTQMKKGIDNNTSLYVGQDVDKMRNDDVKILHNDMTQKNSYFPHPKNPNLPSDGISGRKRFDEEYYENALQQQKPNVKPFTDPAVNNKIIDKTSAFTSNTVKQWSKPDTELELHTVDRGTMDEPNNNKMEEQENIGNMITTVEELRQMKAQGQKLTAETIPILAGEALYAIAVQLADRMLPIGWNEMADTNSMWDYIDENGGMTKDELITAVKEAVNDRLEGDDMGGMMDENNIEEKSTSKSQQRLFGMAHAAQKGEIPMSKLGGAAKKIANTVSDKDVEDFASTKHKGLPEKIDEDETQDEPQEDDCFIQSNGFKNTVSCGGKYIGDFVEDDDAFNAVKQWKIKNNYYPNTWFVSDHGNMTLVDDEGNSIQEINQSLDEVEVNQYILTVKHDDGTVRIRTAASSEEAAIQNVMNAEGCPRQAIKGVKKMENKIQETNQSIIDDNPESMSNKMQPTGTPSTGNVPTGMNDSNGMNESLNLLEEINNELKAYSIHQNKLKKMTEDRKPSSLVLKDRLGAENKTNFKADLQNSDTKDIIDLEKELMWKDQQTDVGKDPQKLGQDLEKTEMKATKGTALENVGDSANDKGNEVPKRNMTSKEQDEINLYRKGQHSLVYDNEPSKRFEDRMKNDMGDKVYEIRQKQMSEFGKAPMYNKDPQPIEDTTAKKVQFDKEQSGWNDRAGLKESMVSGRYRNALNKSHIFDFTLDEVKLLKSDSKLVETLFPLDFTGLGNSYLSKSHDNKVTVNEGVVNLLESHKFFTDGKNVFAIKNSIQKLNENQEDVQKPVINEQFKKMTHLLNYKPETFTNTDNVKKNRGF